MRWRDEIRLLWVIAGVDGLDKDRVVLLLERGLEGPRSFAQVIPLFYMYVFAHVYM